MYLHYTTCLISNYTCTIPNTVYHTIVQELTPMHVKLTHLVLTRGIFLWIKRGGMKNYLNNPFIVNYLQEMRIPAFITFLSLSLKDRASKLSTPNKKACQMIKLPKY